MTENENERIEIREQTIFLIPSTTDQMYKQIFYDDNTYLRRDDKNRCI